MSPIISSSPDSVGLWAADPGACDAAQQPADVSVAAERPHGVLRAADSSSHWDSQIHPKRCDNQRALMYGHSFICFHAQQLHSLMQHTAAELQAIPEDTPGHPNVDNIKSFKGASRNA